MPMLVKHVRFKKDFIVQQKIGELIFLVLNVSLVLTLTVKIVQVFYNLDTSCLF